MSHFSTVKTELRQLEPLVQALEDLGFTPDQGEQPVRGYRGQTVTADLAVSMENGGDLGFRWNAQTGAYELVTDLDLWNQTIPVERFLSKLTQRYALNTVLRASDSEGFQVAEQQVKQDGSIELVVTRWDALFHSIQWIPRSRFRPQPSNRSNVLVVNHGWEGSCVNERFGWMNPFALVAATAPTLRGTPLL